jgi:Nuclease A inhibitor-like protein
MSKPDLSALKQAAAGLLLPSESDEPIEVIDWDHDAETLKDSDVLRLAGCSPSAPMEMTDLKDIFRDAVAGADAAKFRKLIAALNETLADIRVYRIGEIEKDVVIVGKTKAGGWAGLKSKVVET